MVSLQLPTSAQFRELLENPTFVDFLNTFLNLPAFPCRLFYRKSLGSFEVDSMPFQTNELSSSQSLEQESLIGWLLNKRVPLFHKTELYRECTMAMRLSDTVLSSDLASGSNSLQFPLCTNSTCLVARYGDDVHREMESVAGMKSFRAFLKGTPGEHLTTLYLDLMKVCICRDQLRQHRLLRDVLQCYLWSNANKSLPVDIQQQLFLFLHHSVKMSHGIPRVDRTVAVLKEVLDAVVGRLRLYWYRRYVVHRALIRCQLKSQETIGQLCDACRLVIMNDKGRCDFPSLIDQDVRRCDCCAISRLVPCVKLRQARENQTLPSLPGKDLPSPLPSEADNCVTVMGSFDCRIRLPKALVEEAPSTIYKQEVRVASAALMSDQFAGSPFATYLQQRSKTLAVNCLLFWQRALALLQSWNQSDTPYAWDKRIESFLDTFIQNETELDFGLSASLRHQLCHLLPLGYGKQYLIEAQEYAFKILRRQWSKYAARDQDCFWASVNSSSVGLPLKLSKSQVAFFRRPKSPLAANTQTTTANAPVSNNRAWHALSLVLPTQEKGLCEIHGIAGVTSCGSVTSLGSRRGPVLLNKDQLAHTRLKLEEERLQQLWEHRLRESTNYKQENEVSKLETPPKRKPKPSLCLTKPKRFHDVLLNVDYREHFRCYLAGHEAETPLLFWTAVYEMKRQCRTHAESMVTAKQIKRRFFSKAMGKGDALDCKDKLITEIGSSDDVSPIDLFSAASIVAHSLKKQWFSCYRNTFPSAGDDSNDEDDGESKKGVYHQQLKRRGRTRALWKVFVHSVVSFQRGLSNPTICNSFKKYLNSQKYASDGQRKPDHALRRIIKNHVINVGRLVNDLDFWIQAEKYKQMADEAGIPWGTQTSGEEAFVQRKAFAVINCFLDSEVPPRVQVNVSAEVADIIVDAAACGIVERGIFHEASLQIFSILAFYWRRFCVHRFGLDGASSRRRRQSIGLQARRRAGLMPQPSSRRSSTSKQGAHNLAKEQNSEGMGEVDVSCTCVSFSLITGIQMIEPPT